MFDEYDNRTSYRTHRTSRNHEETALAIALSIGLLLVLILANLATK